MRWSPKLLIPLLSYGLVGSSPPKTRWAAYYSDQARPEEFSGYDLIVLDSDRHPPLGALATGGSTVLGYLSVCEVERHRAWFAELVRSGVLIGEKTEWPGSYYVDIRNATWRATVTGRLVPAVLAQGFHGLFLDTLDDAEELERREPARFRGMRGAAVALVKEIRQAFPSITIMVNRGYALLPEIAGQIDIALGESVYGTYDFAGRNYRPVQAVEYRQQVQFLKDLRAAHPALQICTLDYWDPADREGIRRVYRKERANGFIPYVATVALDQLIKEPR